MGKERGGHPPNCGDLRLFAPNHAYLRLFPGKKRLFIFLKTLCLRAFVVKNWLVKVSPA
jgi:hypothetical protein